MNQQTQNTQPIAYKGVAYFALFCFVVYWFITLLMIGLPKTLKNQSPRTFHYYNLVIRQNWHLFSSPSNYNKSVLFVVRDRKNINRSDTFNITKYFIKQRIARAPFNNYYDNLDHILFRISHRLEAVNIDTINALKKVDNTKSNYWYIYEASKRTSLPEPNNIHLSNLVNMCKQVLIHENVKTDGKEYCLLLQNNYVPPYTFTNNEYDLGSNKVIPCFISPYYSF